MSNVKRQTKKTQIFLNNGDLRDLRDKKNLCDVCCVSFFCMCVTFFQMSIQPCRWGCHQLPWCNRVFTRSFDSLEHLFWRDLNISERICFLYFKKTPKKPSHIFRENSQPAFHRARSQQWLWQYQSSVRSVLWKAAHLFFAARFPFALSGCWHNSQFTNRQIDSWLQHI